MTKITLHPASLDRLGLANQAGDTDSELIDATPRLLYLSEDWSSATPPISARLTRHRPHQRGARLKAGHRMGARGLEFDSGLTQRRRAPLLLRPSHIVAATSTSTVSILLHATWR